MNSNFFSPLLSNLANCRILHLVNAGPFLGAVHFDGFTAVNTQKLDNLIAVDPDFAVSLFLGFIKNQLYSEMQVGFINIICIFRSAVTGPSKISNDISGGDDAAFFKVCLIWVILAQMGIIIISFFIKASDSQTPASVLVPADGLHIAGFDRHNRSPCLSHHVMAQMLSAVSIGA